MEIPYLELSPEALKGVVQEFVMREGTDYGSREWTLEEKTQQVLEQIRSGSAKIVFDDKSQTCTIVES